MLAGCLSSGTKVIVLTVFSYTYRYTVQNNRITETADPYQVVVQVSVEISASPKVENAHIEDDSTCYTAGIAIQGQGIQLSGLYLICDLLMATTSGTGQTAATRAWKSSFSFAGATIDWDLAVGYLLPYQEHPN